MPISEPMKEQAFIRSGGRCECSGQHPGATEAPHNGGRCPVTFRRHGRAWEARHSLAEQLDGLSTLSNCEINCLACYRLNLSIRHWPSEAREIH